MTEVTLVDHMGTDLSVVNAARVSFNKKSQWGHHVPGQGIFELKKGDIKLIQYLAKHGHWTPFGHATLSYHIKAPIFVARQLVKHQVGLVWNEVSRRYVEDEPEFYFPNVWRSRPVDKKQGSGKEEIVWLSRDERVGSALQKVCVEAKDTYHKMIRAGQYDSRFGCLRTPGKVNGTISYAIFDGENRFTTSTSPHNEVFASKSALEVALCAGIFICVLSHSARS